MKKQPKLTPESFVQSFAEQGGLNAVKKATGQKCIYYLSGAITHDPYAALKFALAEEYVKRRGHYAVNPMKRNPLGTPWDEAIVNCLCELKHLGEFYLSSLPYLSIIPNLPLPALLLIDPADREIESSGVKLEKGIALANGLPIVEIGLQFGTILEKAIKESEETK
jgi:hypothetical protein